MSLKAFHIFFILCAIFLIGGLGLWQIEGFAKSQSLMELLLGLIFFAGAAGLAVYLLWFLKKNKKHTQEKP